MVSLPEIPRQRDVTDVPTRPSAAAYGMELKVTDKKLPADGWPVASIYFAAGEGKEVERERERDWY